ncbi:hypothetical protein QNH26_18395 [Peribacillus frigoritolerans]|uniref:hypothetical protein n=1 Tax=Peribacillus frigoritolerans TaxID=450367 RepID=UPI0024C19406|nr:hypothetical protein [Peribacillus frigoritolerans]WHX65650.1 hypothetical protein QNH26_18395 [Peribacillus frigoritolerans]
MNPSVGTGEEAAFTYLRMTANSFSAPKSSGADKMKKGEMKNEDSNHCNEK